MSKRRGGKARKRGHAPTPRVLPPQRAPAASASNAWRPDPITIQFAPEQGGELVHVTGEPRLGDQLLGGGSSGPFRVTLHVGSSVSEMLAGNPSRGMAPSLLHLPEEFSMMLGHARDGNRSPLFTFKRDKQGWLDRIEVEIHPHHLDPGAITPQSPGRLVSAQAAPGTSPSGADAPVHDIGAQVAAEEEAYRRAMMVLNLYAFAKRVPVGIHSVASEDLTTGHYHCSARAPFQAAQITRADGLQGGPNDDFVRAFGLYREALVTTDPTYKFLTLFKIWEVILGSEAHPGIRPTISKALKAAGLDPGRPPEKFAAGPYQGRSYGDVLNRELRTRRAAAAHALTESGEEHRLDDLADLREMENAVIYLHTAIREILEHEWQAYQRLAPHHFGQTQMLLLTPEQERQLREGGVASLVTQGLGGRDATGVDDGQEGGEGGGHEAEQALGDS